MRHISAHRMLTVAAVALILGGVLHLIVPAASDAATRAAGDEQNKAILAATSHRPHTTLGTPINLEVPRLKVRLSIREATYNNGWPLNYRDAFFITNSQTPIIYGHAVKEVFLPLNGVAKDELLRITNKKGEVHLFSYTRDRVVAPAQVNVLREAHPGTLILMTCTGAQFENRRLLEFTHIGVAD
ncbi:MAG TPA: sortase [Candidatus Saccharimonadales bacterium]